MREAIPVVALSRVSAGPCAVQDPESTYANLLIWNPGEPVVGPGGWRRGPRWESLGSTPTMNGHGKSDGSISSKKPSNKDPAAAGSAEEVEGRDPPKGNSSKRPSYRTQGRGELPVALSRVRQAARKATPARHHLREEPSMGKLCAGICAGGAP